MKLCCITKFTLTENWTPHIACVDTQVREIHYFFDIRVIRKNKANYLKKPLSHTYRLVVRLILKMFRSYLNHTYLYRRAEVMKDVVVEILIDLKSHWEKQSQ